MSHWNPPPPGEEETSYRDLLGKIKRYLPDLYLEIKDGRLCLDYGMPYNTMNMEVICLHRKRQLKSWLHFNYRKHPYIDQVLEG